MSKKLEVHPVADLFPMLAEDELKDLAADIAERGLLQPIVLDGDGRILDGRNRYAACQLAGVEPQFTTYDGDDPDGYALSVNINRREMSKGQKAMVIVQADGYKNYKREDAQAKGVSQQYVSWARAVLKYTPHLVGDVVKGKPKGGIALKDAYDEAQKVKGRVDSTEELHAELRELNPQLAVLVDNGVRDLDDALKEAGYRVVVAEVDEIVTADGTSEPTFAERVKNGSVSWLEAAILAKQWRTERAESIRRDQDRIRQVVSGWSSVRLLHERPDNPWVKEIREGLGETDVEAVDQILNALKG